MAKYGLVAGENTALLREMFSKGGGSFGDTSGITFDIGWDLVSDLTGAIIQTQGSNLLGLDAVLVLDYAFDANNLDSLAISKEVVNLEASLVATGVEDIKLYILTQHTDVVEQLKGGVNGVRGDQYPWVHILTVKGDVKVNYMSDVLAGRFDTMGIYNKNAVVDASPEEKMEEAGRKIIESTRTVSDDILNYGRDTPISTLSQDDYINSPKTQNRLAEEDKQQQLDARRSKVQAERNARRGIQPEPVQVEDPLSGVSFGSNGQDSVVAEPQPTNTTMPDGPQYSRDYAKNTVNPITELEINRASKRAVAPETPTITGGQPVNVPTPNRGASPAMQQTTNNSATSNRGTSNHVLKDPPRNPNGPKVAKVDTNLIVKNNYTDEEQRLVTGYNQLKYRTTNIPAQKLASDKGIISFVGDRDAGVSGLVAQAAELYASVNQKVLVIDLDILDRSQSLYFSVYDAQVKKGYGDESGLVRATQGKKLESCVVPVTSNIDVLGISRSLPVPKASLKMIAFSLATVLVQARNNYDLVLLDCPMDYLNSYLVSFKGIDRNVFVLENKEYAIENMFAIELNDLLNQADTKGSLSDFIRKSTVILNKYVRGNRDQSGFEITTAYVKKTLEIAGAPYDSLLFSGELPLYDDWEVQYLTNIRYIWKDILDSKTTMGVYKNVLAKIMV